LIITFLLNTENEIQKNKTDFRTLGPWYLLTWTRDIDTNKCITPVVAYRREASLHHP